jgi:hypothetical protein
MNEIGLAAIAAVIGLLGIAYVVVLARSRHDGI